jgi:hypothetical protein
LRVPLKPTSANFFVQPSVRLGVELEENGDVIDLVELPVKSALEFIQAGPEMLEQVRR